MERKRQIAVVLEINCFLILLDIRLLLNSKGHPLGIFCHFIISQIFSLGGLQSTQLSTCSFWLGSHAGVIDMHNVAEINKAFPEENGKHFSKW